MLSPGYNSLQRGCLRLSFYTRIFFLFLLVKFERFHRGNFFLHNLHTIKLHVVVISGDFNQISCSYQAINLNLQCGPNATGSNGEPWNAYAGLSINPRVCNEQTQKATVWWSLWSCLPGQAGARPRPGREPQRLCVWRPHWVVKWARLQHLLRPVPAPRLTKACVSLFLKRWHISCLKDKTTITNPGI